MDFDDQQDEDCTLSAFNSKEELMEAHGVINTVHSGQHAIHAENQSTFNKICDSFRSAEDRIKEIEWRAGLDIPSVNELRYVGFHLIHAIQSSDIKEQDEQLRRAFRHCRRAEYDAVELGILSSLEAVAEFQESYRSLAVIDHVKDYIGILKFCEKIKQRQGLSAESEYRDEYYESVQKDYLVLIDHVALLKGVMPELDKKAAELKDKAIDREKGNRRWKITTTLSVVFGLGGWLILFLKLGTST
jgi:hypothetical protein